MNLEAKAKKTLFLGKTTHNLDEKGRVKIPSKFIKNLNEQIYLNVSIWGEYLEIITESIFEKRFNYFNNINEFDYNASEIKMFLNASTFKIKLDSAGRINIPQEVINNLNITKEVYVIGNGDRIVIWSKDAYLKKYFKTRKKTFENLKELASKLVDQKTNAK